MITDIFTAVYKHVMHNKQAITLTLASLVVSCEGDGSDSSVFSDGP